MSLRRICYVTGTRAEFGLMQSTLAAIRDHPQLQLQIVVTGMHLSRAHGRTIDGIRRAGWKIDAVVPWAGKLASATGAAVRGLAATFDRLEPNVVLVTGDRVEPFAAAAAAHFGGKIVAHVHGGDRAQGQVDDTLRHVITKLSHLHFPATAASAERIFKLGEDRFRIHRTGTPGLDGIASMTNPKRSASRTDALPLVVLHPDDADTSRQEKRAQMLLRSLKGVGINGGIIIASNNDPGWQGIRDAWAGVKTPGWAVHADMPREDYLKLLASSAFLIGNSSSGIIEAASLGTRVINIGNRQKGRERSANVADVPWSAAAIEAAVKKAWNGGKPRVFTGRNVYGGGDAGRRIAGVLARAMLGGQLKNKLIRY